MSEKQLARVYSVGSSSRTFDICRLLLASAIAGILWDRIGPSAPFWAGAIVATAALCFWMLRGAVQGVQHPDLDRVLGLRRETPCDPPHRASRREGESPEKRRRGPLGARFEVPRWRG